MATTSENTRSADSSSKAPDSSPGVADSSPKTAEPGPSPVRRRGKVLEHAIFEAVLDELVSSGYAMFSMEAVANRAQTGKASLYRRWGSREALVLDALQALLPEPGSARTPVTSARTCWSWSGGCGRPCSPFPARRAGSSCRSWTTNGAPPSPG